MSTLTSICLLFTIGTPHSNDRGNLADKALTCAYALSNQSILQACDNNFESDGWDVRNSSCEWKVVSLIRNCVFYCNELREAHATKCETIHHRGKTNDQWHRCMALSKWIDNMRCTPTYTAFNELPEQHRTSQVALRSQRGRREFAGNAM